jgi:ATP-dependent helicase YprA (DUF1998 family)
MILYDRYPGGLGYCERGFRDVRRLLEICHDLVRDCPCEEDGCPSCVGLPNLRPAIHSDPDLTRGYPMPGKAATMALLDCLLAPASVFAPPNSMAPNREPYTPKPHAPFGEQDRSAASRAVDRAG